MSGSSTNPGNSATPGNADMLGATVLFSLILHALVIFGITFSIAKPKATLPSLDVTLVNTANRQAPKHADYLAQANNSGGGNSDKAHKPSQPFSSPLPKPDPGIAPRHVRASAAQPQPHTGPRLVTTKAVTNFSVRSEPQQHARPRQTLPPTRRDQRDMEMARLSAEVSAESKAYAKRPRKKFISANTKEYVYAAYMRAWTHRVERVGTINFPSTARSGRLTGQLILTVGLNRDGSIHSIDIIQSSGRKRLDADAKRIVRLAGPFPPIPHTDEHVDLLYITRTYQFLHGGTLETR